MNHQHFLLNKPAGYLSQFVNNQTKRKNKKLLGDLYNFPAGTMAIGRLDEKSEGLLLLTTDGNESERIRSKYVEKEYYVELDGEITNEAIEQLTNGVSISIFGRVYKTLPCSVKELIPKPPHAKDSVKQHRPTSWITITLIEGKFRQIRKMTAAVGYPTVRLIRVRVGKMHLATMKPGEVQEIATFEI